MSPLARFPFNIVRQLRDAEHQSCHNELLHILHHEFSMTGQIREAVVGGVFIHPVEYFWLGIHGIAIPKPVRVEVWFNDG